MLLGVPELETGHARPVARGEGTATSSQPRLPAWAWAAIAVAAVAAIAFFATRQPAPAVAPSSVATPRPPAAEKAAPKVNEKSLAVLPFENLRPDTENEFFTSGIHEEILAALQTLRELRVIQYRGAKKSIRQVGGELKVAFALECSVRRAGTKVRVTGKLTNTRTEEQAWVELAFTHAFRYSRNQDHSDARIERARAALTAMQRLAPGDPETLRTEGNFYYFISRDYAHALELFNQSVALRPNDPENYTSLCQVQRRQGRWAECMENFRKAIALDPQNDRLLRNAATMLNFCRRYNEALALAQRRAELNPASDDPLLDIAVSHFRSRGSITEGDRMFRDASVSARVIWAMTIGDFKEVLRLDPQGAVGWPGYTPFAAMAAGGRGGRPPAGRKGFGETPHRRHGAADQRQPLVEAG